MAQSFGYGVIPLEVALPAHWPKSTTQLNAELRVRREKGMYKVINFDVLIANDIGDELLKKLVKQGFEIVTLAIAARIDPLRLWEFIYGASNSLYSDERRSLERQLSFSHWHHPFKTTR